MNGTGCTLFPILLLNPRIGNYGLRPTSPFGDLGIFTSSILDRLVTFQETGVQPGCSLCRIILLNRGALLTIRTAHS